MDTNRAQLIWGGGLFANNSLVGLGNAINLTCPRMWAGLPAKNTKTNKWYLSVYDTRCAYESCYPRPANTLRMYSGGNQILAPKTIQQVGCSLTTLAMALKKAGVSTVDPVTLNDFMSNAAGPGVFPLIPPQVSPAGVFNDEGNVAFEDTVKKVRAATGKTLKFVAGSARSITDPPTAYGALDAALCSPNPAPVIVGVDIATDGNPTHYVLVTKKLTSLDPHFLGHFQYQIEDPGKGGATTPCPSPCTLDSAGYLDKTFGFTDFKIRGVVTDPTDDQSELNISVGSDADIQVADPNGLQTGADPATGSILEQVPGSVYWRDSERNQVTGADDTGIAHSVLISTPALGAYTLSVRAYSQDGTAQPATSMLGIAGPGSSSSVQVQFASTPGSTSTVTLAATFPSTLQDISNSLQLGLIDNQGIANSLSRKINAASVAATGGDNTTAANVLRAFTNEVKRLAEAVRDGIDEAGKPGTGDDRERREAEHRQRQDEDREHTGKHISGIAPQVLLADAAYLISQLR